MLHVNGAMFSLVLYKKTRDNIMFLPKGGGGGGGGGEGEEYDFVTTPVSMVGGIYTC